MEEKQIQRKAEDAVPDTEPGEGSQCLADMLDSLVNSSSVNIQNSGS